jgi:hypothetical protein
VEEKGTKNHIKNTWKIKMGKILRKENIETGKQIHPKKSGVEK